MEHFRSSETAKSTKGRPALRWAGLCLLTVGWMMTSAGAASAQTPVKLKITVRSVVSQDCMDVAPCDGASFYANVLFDGAIYSNIRQNSQWYGRDTIFPNWSFVWDTHSQDTVDVDIEVWDEDGFFRGADDQLDLDPAAGQTIHARRLSFRVDVQECINGTNFALTGEASGSCGRVRSTGLEPGIRGTITLDVEVETPPHAPGLRVRCLHDPIWPQAGDTVTVTAEALDDAAVNPAGVAGSDLEIWVNPTAGAAQTCTGTVCTFQTGPVQAGGAFTYACLARNNGNEAWSGWRTSQIGNTLGNRAIPVLLTGSPSSRIDIVLVPTRRTCNAAGTCVNFPSALDPNFLTRAREVIRESFYSWDIHLRNQDALNFWLATDLGDSGSGCALGAPADWSSVYSFADAGAVLHENSFRDCAHPSDRLYSSESFSFDTIMHETGHSPFGLTDEYCCDTAYEERADLPNVYGSEAACHADVPQLLHWDPSRTASDCREIQRTNADGSIHKIGWWVSDPPTNDMMADSGNRAPNASDTRRIEWIYNACKEASCLDVRP